MASGWFTKAFSGLNGAIDLDSDTLKIMLIQSGYTYDPDQTDVTTLAASEATCTGYTGGFGGAGRKVATVTSQQNNTQNEWDWAIANLTWTGLGGAVNNTLIGAAIIKEVTNDAGSFPVAYFEFSSSFTTNGSDVTLSFLALASRGNLRIAA